VAAAAESLVQAHTYTERGIALPTHDSATKAYIDVLRAIADELPYGKLTCTA
jgi:hypothetical protein